MLRPGHEKVDLHVPSPEASLQGAYGAFLYQCFKRGPYPQHSLQSFRYPSGSGHLRSSPVLELQTSQVAKRQLERAHVSGGFASWLQKMRCGARCAALWLEGDVLGIQKTSLRDERLTEE